MKKKFGICFGYLVFFNIFTGLSTWLFSALLTDKRLAITIAAAVFVLGIFLGFTLQRKRPLPVNSAIIALSGIGTGLAVSAYFIHVNFKDFIDLATLGQNILLADIAVLTFYCLYGLSLNIPILERHIKLYTYSVLIVFLLLTIALWANQDKFLFSLVFYFYSNTALFVFPLIMRVETIKDLIFRLTVASFGALLLITLVTLIIISEGDGFDLDLSGRGVIDVESPKKSKINEPNEH